MPREFYFRCSCENTDRKIGSGSKNSSQCGKWHSQCQYLEGFASNFWPIEELRRALRLLARFSNDELVAFNLWGQMGTGWLTTTLNIWFGVALKNDMPFELEWFSWLAIEHQVSNDTLSRCHPVVARQSMWVNGEIVRATLNEMFSVIIRSWLVHYRCGLLTLHFLLPRVCPWGWTTSMQLNPICRHSKRDTE